MALTIKGVQIQLDARDEALVAAEIVEQAERADAAEAKVAELSTAAGAAAVQVQALTARVDAAEQRVAKIDRAELEQAAKVALGVEFKFDGKSDAEIKSAVVSKMLPSVRMDGADSAFVQGAYSAALALATDAATKREQAARESGNRSDSNPSDPNKAREEMIAARRNLAASKS